MGVNRISGWALTHWPSSCNRQISAFKPKDVFGSRFRLIKRLGQGGYGDVWKARDLWLRKDIATKVGKYAYGESERPLLREVTLFRNLPSAYYIQLFDYVREDTLEAFTMELLAYPWRTLDEFNNNTLKSMRGRDPIYKIRGTRLAISICIELLSVLRTLHGQKYSQTNRWCHGDIKPLNIFINTKQLPVHIDNWASVPPGGFLKLGDFGLATEQGQTLSGFTYRYGAPEQKCGRAWSQTTDIFAVGQTVAELITGKTLAEDEVIHIKRIRQRLSIVPSRYLVKTLTDAIRKMTYKNPVQRPAASTAAREMANIVATEDEWAVLEELSRFDRQAAQAKGDVAKALFPRFAKSRGWKYQTQARIDEVTKVITSMYKKKMIFKKGHGYYM
jgi:eukaryotic-like serine/threonine-protein kinase